MKRSLYYCWMVMVLMPWSLSGQMVAVRGEGVPLVTIEGNWYLDTLNHVAWHRSNAQWGQLKLREVTNVVECHRNIAFYGYRGCWTYSDTGKLVDSLEYCQCYGQLMVIGSEAQQHYVQGDTILGWSRRFPPKGIPDPPDMAIVQGVVSFCATPYSPMTSNFFFDQNHYWGMLGTNGKWLIEPLYDEPFIDSNWYWQVSGADQYSISEPNSKERFFYVLYYGQKRKINEKGEFVE